MKAIAANLRTPTIISFLLVLPWMVLEWVNRRGYDEGFPFPLFLLMWLLPLVFILILIPIVRSFRAQGSLLSNPLDLILRVTLLALIAVTWSSLLMDQMPCFLGVPNCD